MFSDLLGLTIYVPGLGGFPPSHPLCLGMMGMHGEAYVNSAIQRADLLLAMERLHAFYMSRYGLNRPQGLSINGRQTAGKTGR